MAEPGRTWLARRAERQYGQELGLLRHTELSWHISWKLLPWFIGAGFVFAAVAEFTGQPTSSRGPGLFSNLPLYAVASILTGLVLWSLTLLLSFRRLLVFDRGLLYRYSQKHAARAIFWEDIDAGTLRSVVAPAGTDADRLLRTLNPEDKISLGVRGQFAVVFRAKESRVTATAQPASGSDGTGKPLRFYTFTTRNSPDQLVGMIQNGLRNTGAPEAAAAFQALPPAVVHSAVSLD
ncbi:hypothetical protein [Arthrobacter oryzae]|uniref:hypothetical protein n=1 Tax=Arthrobacter oryzae TaxID=409290 RepID=UPI00273CECA5|nr:hypothetical protein [Arthrobacter oryzae]WLQ08225.1 hypothetical protein Q8Z05_08785 [Arthrobacter oryzae]